MGRTPKYFTYEQKQAAKRAQAKAYRDSEKGKRTKAEANRRRYQHNQSVEATDGLPVPEDPPEDATDLTTTARELTPDIPLRVTIDSFDTLDTFDPFAHSFPERGTVGLVWDPEHLPDDLIACADKPLPISFTVCGPGPLLGLWTPPFCFVRTDEDPVGSTSTNIWDGTTSLSQRSAVLSAFQCRAVLAAARDRRKRWVHTPLEEVKIEVETEIAARVDAWSALRDLNVDDSRTEDECLALDWGSKIVCMLADEWYYRQHGVDVYTDMIQSGEMPWQLMIADVMASSGAKN
ncbi:hypothetical protein L226DRAFT_525852 [Lentinus tigrinus ALCF2SS1-7]|uniref:uncharacterized protein n=1 Tax=Lentinus tigrinus ALCF2SS1-7 TaxID=1328758 RepID=UPI001165D276|nr:hypothetical protein L226DRAFT_525852 [Lentinus tigrinus ALCF2SS1-7]